MMYNINLCMGDDNDDAWIYSCDFFDLPGDSLDASKSPPLKAIPQFKDSIEKIPQVSLNYKMNHKSRGYAVIINNRDFHPATQMSTRNGTDRDADILYKRLIETLGFGKKFVKVFNNVTACNMKKLLIQAASTSHVDCDMFVCAILSHGDASYVYGVDAPLCLSSLLDPFKADTCPSLAGKPKIFIVQACRGDRLMKGVEVYDAIDSTCGAVSKIPSEADFLTIYSTVEGYFSWRNSSYGSWFVQALCACIAEFKDRLDFVKIVSRASHLVAYEFESNALGEFGGKKQVPQMVSTLTKDLYL